MTEVDAIRAVRLAIWARALVFLVASCVCLLMFAGYIGGMPPGSQSPGLRLLDQFGGLPSWAVLFGLAGAAGVVAAALRSRSRWLVVIQGALFGAFGAAHTLGWFIEGGRGYVAAAPWLLCECLALALLLLPARRR